MVNLFLKLLNMSITAGWIVLAVLALRFLLKKAPKWLVCLLWAAVAVRLVLPFSIESMMSMVPSSETVPQNIVIADTPVIDSGIPIIDSTFNPILSDMSAPTATLKGESVSTMQIVTFAATVVWIVGLFAMMVYAVISYLRIYRKVKISMPYEGNIYICDSIDSPFILGIMRPKIYLPSSLDAMQYAHVIAHERAHIHRRDHLWKPFGFLLLSVYWFHPLLWVGYIFLCRDLEGACDEKVVKDMSGEEKAAYSDTLLACSVTRRMISACPVAFGETGVKSRIKSVLHYKKPAFWVIILTVIACTALAICFLTDPVKDKEKAETESGDQTENEREPDIGEIDFSDIELSKGTTENLDAFYDALVKKYGTSLSGIPFEKERFKNVTPISVKEPMSCDIFKMGGLSFLWIYGGEVYRLDPEIGGYGVTCALPCDFDGDTIKDLLYVSNWGSGRDATSICMFNAISRETVVLHTADATEFRMIATENKKVYSVYCKKDIASNEWTLYGYIKWLSGKIVFTLADAEPLTGDPNEVLKHCCPMFSLWEETDRKDFPDAVAIKNCPIDTVREMLGKPHFDYSSTFGVPGYGASWWILSDGSIVLQDNIGYAIIPYEKAMQSESKFELMRLRPNQRPIFGSFEPVTTMLLTVANSQKNRPAIQKRFFYAYDAGGKLYKVKHTSSAILQEGKEVIVVYQIGQKTDLADGTISVVADEVMSDIITKKQAAKIKKGMTLAQIQEILGPGNSDISNFLTNVDTYVWNIQEGGTLTVKVALKGTISNYYSVAESVTITN
ncbi:MAG: hypothetical protein E7616_09740 [Ruminococcaceae bacterium]|nr:hypothetical protein [Oscillospiraceae bacterium]